MHTCPNFILIWGSAYYVCDDSIKFQDQGDFNDTIMNQLPLGSTFVDNLPFMDLFPNTPCLALRYLKTPTGIFKPSWGSGLVFPDGVGTSKYGDLGSGQWKLVDTKNGTILTSCDVSVKDPKQSAQNVMETYVKFFCS